MRAVLHAAVLWTTLVAAVAGSLPALDLARPVRRTVQPSSRPSKTACAGLARFTILRHMRSDITFRELTDGMHDLIALLGYDVRVVPYPDCLTAQDAEVRCARQPTSASKLDIYIANSFCFDEVMVAMPEPAIIWQLEVLPGTERGCLTNARMASMLTRNVVWDYSYINLLHLEAALKTRIHGRWMPILWVPGVPVMADSSRSVTEDIDVLFLGAVNDRRRVVLDKLSGHGLRVVATDAAYGRDRDRLLLRSKVVVNIHYYEAGLLEAYRLWTIGAMRRFVVSEDTPDKRAQAHFDGSVVFAPYDALADTVVAWLKQPRSLRAAISDALYNHIVNSNTADVYAKALQGAVTFHTKRECV